MDPITLALIVQGAMGVGQMISGNINRRKALDEFSYEIPDATKEQVKIARGLATQRGLPGEDTARALAESKAARTVERGFTTSETASDALGLLSDVHTQTLDFEKEMQIKGAERYDMNQKNLISTLGLLAQAEQEKFYYNEYVPFLSKMGMAGQQMAGGSQNIGGAFQGGLQMGLNEADMKHEKELYEMYLGTFGGGNSDPAPMKPTSISNSGSDWTNSSALLTKPNY